MVAPSAPRGAYLDRVAHWRGVQVCVRDGESFGGSDELTQGGLSLFAMLDEIGGHLDARLRRDHSEHHFRGPRHLSLAPAGVEVWGHCDRPARFKAVFVRFDDELLEEAREHGLRAAPSPRLMFDDPAIWTMASRLAQECLNPQTGSRLLGDGLAAALAAEVLRLGGEEAPAAATGLAPWQVRRVTEFLNLHFDRDPSIGELAALVGLSPFHFARSFRASTGVTPGRYHSLVRLERAKALLTTTRMKTIEVALAVGYDSPQSLSRLFRRELGLCPSAYRRATTP